MVTQHAAGFAAVFLHVQTSRVRSDTGPVTARAGNAAAPGPANWRVPPDVHHGARDMAQASSLPNAGRRRARTGTLQPKPRTEP